MANLDELQIQITASSKEADSAIQSLTSSLNNLNRAIEGLNTSKISSFATAMSKLANVGANTSTTAKAIKGMASDLSSSFGIKTKKGISEVTQALNELYKSYIIDQKEQSPVSFEKFMDAQGSLKEAIKAHYSYQTAVDDSTKKVEEFVKAQKASGVKIGFKNLKGEFQPEAFKQLNKDLGGILDPKHTGAEEGFKELDEFLRELKDFSGADINIEDIAQGIQDVQTQVNIAKDSVLNFAQAFAQGEENAHHLESQIDAIVKQFMDLYTVQSQFGATSGLGSLVEVFKQISNIQMPDFSGVADAIKATQGATGKVGETAPNVETVAQAMDDVSTSTQNATSNVEELSNALMAMAQESGINNVSEMMGEFASRILEAAKAAGLLENKQKLLTDSYYDPIDTSGEWIENNPPDNDWVRDQAEAFQEAAKKADDAAGTIENAQKRISKGHVGADVLENLVALGEAFEKLGQKLNAAGDKGIKLFKTLTTPLKMAAEEYKEKFEHMGQVVANFQANFKAHMAKLAAFWKRTMKTFTFMLVRKAITAIIKEVGNAVQSLAMYSNAMGTAFNTDISNMVADFQYLGRSIVSVFAPLINMIAPIIDAIVSKIATLLSYIGMLFAALGGKATFTKAKKNVDNYAESLDSASKSAKNLTMGIDELNILADNKSGGGAKPYDGWEDAWEEADIPQWVKDLSNWLKDLWHNFFDPIKEAWDRAKQYVIDGFKTMLLSLKRLMSDIGRDFFEMWNQEKTIRMFEQIFKILGDIFRVVRNLADQFDEAWNKGRIGLKIFENLRDIAYNLVDHVRNVTYYMIQWAKGIDFSPLLQSFEKLTSSLVRMADFIGGLFEDAMVEGVLKYVEFMIEEGVPHLQNTLADVFDAFSFTEIRKNLKKIWGAFEEMFENIHIGTTEAIGNLGKMVAKFTKSKEFTDFLQRVVDITKLITKERVEKVLTGLGKGILNIAKSVVKFVNSDAFMKFLEAIAKWIDNHSVDQIAGILEKIAGAILLFKFGGFAAEKLAGFFQFFTIITALRNLGTIASELTTLSAGLAATGEGASAVAASASGVTGFGAALSGLLPIIGSVITAFLEFKGVSDSVEKLTLILDGGEGSLGGTILGLIAKVGAAAAAFTLLLGFPAGVIAAGCVAAVAAIKGINDAVEQINFDSVTDAILTQGDTTVAQVRQWYEETTAVVVENCQIWKNTERDLVQGRDDIDSYARSIEGLQSAFSSNVQATVGMGNELIGIYESMGSSITNYIDVSTQAMVDNLLAQRGYLESQGKDVDEMIAQLLVGADNQKNIVNDAVSSMNEAQKAYSDSVEKYGADSKQAQEAYENLKTVINETSGVFEQYQSSVDEVDTSEAVAQITELGKSLDLSQYDYEGGWEDAVNDITTSVQDIKNTTESGLQEINETYQQKIQELNDYREKNPFMPEEYYKVEMDAITSQWATDTQTLTSAAEQALDLYDSSLALKLQDVAAHAEEEWDNTNPFKRFFTMGTDKDAYIYSQMQTYVNEHLGDSGLTGAIKDAYSVLPDNVHPSAVEAVTRLANDTANAYQQATYNTEDYTKGAVAGTYQNVVNAIPNLVEYDPSSKAFIDKQMNAAKLAAEGAHYDEISGVLVDGTGKALIASSPDLEAYNRMVAGYGVNAMTDEYKTQLSEQADLFEAVKVFGQDIPKGVVEGINEEVEAGTVLDSVESIFKPIPDFIHNLPFFPFGSPNLKMKEYGKDTVLGYNLGIDENKSTTKTSISGWFTEIKAEMANQIRELKNYFNEGLVSIFSADGVDIVTPITTLFQNVTLVIQEQLVVLGELLIGETLPSFLETYLTPWFSNETWQPLFDLLHEETLVPNFENFLTWWDEEAIRPWWEDHLVNPWFTKEKWDDDIFTPLKENIYEHFRLFLEWWDETMETWWDEHVKPHFEKEKWTKLFDNVLEATKEVFKKIADEIQDRINDAKDAVVSACEEMKGALQEVLDLIGDVLEAMGDFGNFEGKVTFDFGGKFAEGGFPTQGSLFLANEAGAELVGSVGGRTAVASNQEITGIADAVYATGNQESILLSQLISLTKSMLDKDPVVIGDREIARMANNGQSQLGMSIIT